MRPVAFVAGVLVVAGCATSSRIHQAAAGSDVTVLTSLLESGANPAERGTRGRTPLHFVAAMSDNPANVLALVRQGASVDALDDDGHTPLHLALIQNGTLDVVAALLTSGAGVNKRVVSGGFDLYKDKGWTPLHLAARFHSDPAVVAMLIEKGAYVEAAVWNGDYYGWNAQDVAALNDSSSARKIAQVLRKAGVPSTGEHRRTAAAAHQSDGFDWGKAAAIAGVAAVGVAAADAGVPVEDVVEATAAVAADIINETGGEKLAPVAGNQDATGGTRPASERAEPTSGPSTPPGIGSATGGRCEIPGYAEGNPHAFDASTTQISWCRDNTSPTDQLGYLALDAELHRCALSLGHVAPDRIASFAASLRERCDSVAALASRGPYDCRCPASYYQLGRD